MLDKNGLPEDKSHWRYTMIDFSECKVLPTAYSGVSGKKIAVRYNGARYMLKFSSIADKNPNLSYSNSCYSEYLGCKIFEMLHVPVQEVLLGTYKGRLVVACKDFREIGDDFSDFCAVKNTTLYTGYSGAGTELDDVLETILDQNIVDKSAMLNRFWDMFIVDALIGNWDRHNGNWGTLYNHITEESRLAPVYDCGSCLLPQANEDIMNKVLSDSEELDSRVYNLPLSAIKRKGKRINYFYFISSLKYDGCNEALKRIVPRIDLCEINRVIDQMPVSDLQKQFYKTVLKSRKEKILDYSYNKLMGDQIRKMNIEV